MPGVLAEPHWTTSSLQVPRPWRPWLFDKGSLTARLQALSGGAFSVTCLHQDWGRPLRSEARLLGIPMHQKALIREVLLLGNGVPWVYARSILPASTLTGPLKALRHLDNKPLGALLFKSPSMSRGAIEVAQLPRQNLPEVAVQKITADGPEGYWGRRSVFKLYEKPLLVSEFFLPDFPGVEPKHNQA